MTSAYDLFKYMAEKITADELKKILETIEDKPDEEEKKCECIHGEVHCGLCVKPYACEPGMKHAVPSIEHPEDIKIIQDDERIPCEQCGCHKLGIIAKGKHCHFCQPLPTPTLEPIKIPSEIIELGIKGITSPGIEWIKQVTNTLNHLTKRGGE